MATITYARSDETTTETVSVYLVDAYAEWLIYWGWTVIDVTYPRVDC